jgi:hypothetical protein
MMERFISLKFLWDIFKPAVSDSLKERLKPRDSSEIAKKRMLRLYVVLTKVSDYINDFISELICLTAFIERNKLNPNLKRYYQYRDNLQRSAGYLVKSLDELSDALLDVNPQLEIYQNLLASNIHAFLHGDRKLLMDEDTGFLKDEYIEIGRDFIPDIEFEQDGELCPETVADLYEIVRQASMNRERLMKAIEDCREFIAREFTFKDSF